MRTGIAFCSNINNVYKCLTATRYIEDKYINKPIPKNGYTNKETIIHKKVVKICYLQIPLYFTLYLKDIIVTSCNYLL